MPKPDPPIPTAPENDDPGDTSPAAPQSADSPQGGTKTEKDPATAELRRPAEPKAHRHQAIGMLPSEKEPNTVINVLQKGYALHDRVVRPALVTIAAPKDAQA